jgi:hypothetical protein
VRPSLSLSLSLTTVSLCVVYCGYSVGYGDICPGKLTFESKIFLTLYLYAGLGIFCGPVMNHASSWRHHVPGGLTSLASLTIGIGAAIFTYMEGLSQSEAIYASVITGELCASETNM